MTTDPFTLAVSLARPVSLGFLSPDQAEAAIVGTVARRLRLEGSAMPAAANLPSVNLPDVARVAVSILRMHLARLEVDRDRVIGAIVRGTSTLIAQLVAQQCGRGRVRAEAHDINADRGRLLRDDEVEAVLVQRVRYAVAERDGTPPARRPGRRRHGR